MPVFDVRFKAEVKVVEKINAKDQQEAYSLASAMIAENSVGDSLDLDWWIDTIDTGEEEED